MSDNRQKQMNIALYRAVKEGDLYRAEESIRNGANLNIKEKHGGKTMVHIAYEKGDLLMVQFLITKGANLNAKDDDGKTPLNYACEGNNIKIIKKLIQYHADVNQISENPDTLPTPLMVACENGNAEITKCLIKNGADVNLNFKGKTALKCACNSTKSIKCFKILLQNHANPNEILDDSGMTILHYACEIKNYKAVKLLIEYDFLHEIFKISIPT